MATSITTITNISNQAIPILVNDIASNKASANSDLAAGEARQLQLAPGSQIRIESIRLDQGQLDQLRNKRLITYTAS